MNSDAIESVKSAVGEEKLRVLTDIFQSSQGNPPKVRADRYRADHPGWFDILDRLESNQLFLSRDRSDAGCYQLRVYALPLLNNERAKHLMRIMDHIYGHLQAIYREQLSAPVKVAEIINRLGEAEGGADEELVKEALHYMADGHAVWSSQSTGYPYEKDAQLGVSEAVLRHADFSAVLFEFYEWHILNPEKRINAPLIDLVNANNKRHVASFFGKPEAQQPEWYDQLDSSKKALIFELDVALKSELAALPTMGLRTLIEVIILEHITEKGSFKKNLMAFVEAGFITKQNASIIENVVDAGHAAIHRAYFPNSSDLHTCVEIVKHLMHGIYILKPKVDRMSANTPKREQGAG